MNSSTFPPFARRGSGSEIEEGLAFQPKFNSDGLIPAFVTDAASGQALMVAWMNADALALTIRGGLAHFWSRSRCKLWKKGEDSGNVMHVVELRADCDQDALWLKVNVAGAGTACHTGRRTCFYRVVTGDTGAGAGVALALVAESQ